MSFDHSRRIVVALAAVSLLIFNSQQSPAAQLAFQNQIAAGNPLLWYKLAESTGNAINYGSLGNAFDGLYFGTIDRAAATVGGDAGAGFDSTDDYIESLGASPLVGNPTFSIETLIFLPAAGTASLWGPFLHWGDGGGGNGALQRNGREVYFSVQNTNLNRTYAGFYNAGQRTTSVVPLGEWLHIVWTRTGGGDTAVGTTLYINGSSVALQQDPNLNPGFLAAAGIDVNSTAFRINRGSDYVGTRKFTGTMDEMALYDRVLSPAEVLGHACSIALCDNAAGDYNNDGTVNAADYTVWRNHLGENITLPHDTTPGSVTRADFDVWKLRYGQPTSGSASAVPEPISAVLLLMCGILGMIARGRATFK